MEERREGASPHLLIANYSGKGLLGVGWRNHNVVKGWGIQISLGCILVFPTDNGKLATFLTATKVKWQVLPLSPPGCLPREEGPGKVLKVTRTVDSKSDYNVPDIGIHSSQ